MDGGDPITGNSRLAVSEVRSSRSHSEAERKRRQRINGHLATLRTLLPSATRVSLVNLTALCISLYIYTLHLFACNNIYFIITI